MDKDTSEVVDILNHIDANMATKDDITELRAEIATKTELANLRAELNQRFSSVDTQLKDVRADIREIRTCLDTIEAELKKT